MSRSSNKSEASAAPRLRLVEEFYTVQGTGHLVGLPQYFVRLSGCSVGPCPLRQVCDEPDALRPDYGGDACPASVATRALDVVGSGGWLHVTGGEPFDQLRGVSALGMEAERRGLKVHYQTSGTRPVDLPWDWITVSPKCPPGELAVKFGQEMVLLDGGIDLAEMRAYYEATKFWFYYLQPVWGEDSAATIQKVLDARREGLPFSFTDQLHKRWGVR